ncbi:MAG: asparagine synthase (glutamine-hydrolyzing) [Bacteroidetes bacterium]|nr:asparagine synthase (glutamine-hydrolyzing) [Bacteroidota bacterium]
MSIIVSKNEISVSDLIKMTEIIKHRGPDDEGYILFDLINNNKTVASGPSTPISVSSNCISSYRPSTSIYNLNNRFQLALGHRRLSILDLTENGHMPMCDDNGNLWITYNGEIFNYIEIRNELENLGYIFFTDTDTEVILNSYKEWGESCLNHFNGMWAFAIYDLNKKKIFLSRDRFGIKPLYYWISPMQNLHFASEIKQFTVCEGWEAVLNGEMAYDYLMYALTDHTDQTMFKGVYHLPAGCSISLCLDDTDFVSGQKIKYSRWYIPKHNEFCGSFEDAKMEFNRLFKSAVSLHLRSDVYVGSALSGGLDSSAVVCYINSKLKEEGKEEIQKTFSSCSYDKQFDEKHWMDIVINHTNVDANFVYPEGKNIFDLSEKIIWHQDEPYQSQSAFSAYHVFECAKKNNVTVLLNGQGADEYLSGYNAFSMVRKLKMLKKGKLLSLFREENYNFSMFAKSISKLIYLTLPTNLTRIITTKTQRFRRLKKVVNINKLVSHPKHPYEKIPYDNSNSFNISFHQLLYEPLQKYLRWEDRNSMAHSIEARVPFLDYRLVEFTTNLPIAYLDAKDEKKKILVHSLTDILPIEILNRKDKMGFITPEQKWFTQDYFEEFSNVLHQYMPYAKGIIDYDEANQYFINVKNGVVPFEYDYWRILSFCIWMKVFDVRL